jgi:uncharacterized membrane protein
MNKTEFLSELVKNLKVLESEKKEILSDYEEHFQIGMAEGRSESEICDALGDPSKIARNYTASALVKKAEKDHSAKSILKAIIAALGLGFFNLVVGLPLLITLITIIIVLFSVSVAIFASGFALIITSIIYPFFESLGLSIVAGLFAGVGLLALGTLMIIGSSYITKWTFSGLLKYLKANINIIKEG